jgi:LmbE family N-acetylglucosaminyl deacetylase
MSRQFLIVAAHPDDEILCCGATAARLVQEGWTGATLILGEGVTSRDAQRDVDARHPELTSLRADIEAANRVLGIAQVFVHAFPDNRFDSVALLDLVKVVEEVKQTVQPELIFTHSAYDLNIDHQRTHQAVLTATRPMVGETVRTIYAGEVLSATEWNYPQRFQPDTFFDVTATLALKQQAMAVYTSELREFPHPRSLEGIALAARTWGMKVGLPAVEAFMTVRRLC